jgi:hypothetical protein
MNSKTKSFVFPQLIILESPVALMASNPVEYTNKSKALII